MVVALVFSNPWEFLVGKGKGRRLVGYSNTSPIGVGLGVGEGSIERGRWNWCCCGGGVVLVSVASWWWRGYFFLALGRCLLCQ